MTIKDIFGSLQDNVVRKMKNPFWGTFTIVFVLKNWQLFYSLLFFDSSETRLTRIQYIEQYIDTHDGALCIFGMSLWFTLFVLVLSYSFAQIGIYISHFAEAKVTPWVVKLATKGAKVVTKEQYDDLEKVYAQTLDKLQEEKRKRAESDTENDKLQQKIVELTKKDITPVDGISVPLEEEAGTKISKDKIAESREKKIVKTIFERNWDKEFMNIIGKTESRSISMHEITQTQFGDYLVIQGILAGNEFGIAYFTDFGEKVRIQFAEEIA